MQQTTHSEEMAILFADWIADNLISRHPRNKAWKIPGSKTPWYTTRKLYKEFILSYYSDHLTKNTKT